MLASFSKGQTEQCTNAQAHQASEGLCAPLGSDVRPKLKSSHFAIMKQISWKLSKAYFIRDPLPIGKAVWGYLFSQWTILTATAWDSIGESDGLGLNFTCSEFCLDAYLLPHVQPIVWCKSWLFLTNYCGRCMRSVRGPAPLCLVAFVPPSQIASQAFSECNSKYAARQKWLFVAQGPEHGICD